MSAKQIQGLQHQLTSLISLIKSIIVNLKRQSSRIFSITSRYKTQKQSNGILSSPSLKNTHFKDLEQYSELVSKQFTSRLEQLIHNNIQHKIGVEKLFAQCKSKPTEDYATRIKSFNKSIKELEQQLATIWSQEHFLVLNFRLDIAAKEIQRWTAIMQSHKLKKEEIEKTIDDLFI